MVIVYNRPSTLKYRRDLRRDMTDAEKVLWYSLRRNQFGVKWRRQYSVGPYILDFYCPTARLAVELDGSQHFSQESYDQQRTKFLNELDITVQRYWNNDVLANLESVLEHIWTLITPPCPPLGKGRDEINNSPLSQGGGST